MIEAATLEALRRALGEGALCALLCDRDVVRPLRPVWGVALGPSFVGPARTVAAPVGGLDAVRSAAGNLNPGDVLVIAADGIEAAMWGDTLAHLAHERGAAGVVVDGYVRDVAQLQRIGASVRARGTFPRRAQALGSGRADVVVETAGARVAPGEIVIADYDGVVVLAAQDVARVVRDLPGWLEAESGG